MTYLALIVGGIVGGVVRYLLECIVPAVNTFPVTTLIINLSGSLTLGAFYGIADVRGIKPWLRVGFGTGVVGSFTTFSTFSLEMTHLHLDLAIIYGVCSMLGGPLFVLLGGQFVVLVSRRGISAREELSA